MLLRGNDACFLLSGDIFFLVGTTQNETPAHSAGAFGHSNFKQQCVTP
jgi:hypothetical protein